MTKVYFLSFVALLSTSSAFQSTNQNQHGMRGGGFTALHESIEKRNENSSPSRAFTTIQHDSANNKETNYHVPFLNQNNRRSFLASTATTALLSAFASFGGMGMSPASAMAAGSTTSSEIITPAFSKELSWPLGKVAFSLLPLAATSTRRATVEECVIENTIWTHDQLQGVVNVNVPVRQIVVKVRKKYFD